jgi:uncharacterized protein
MNNLDQSVLPRAGIGLRQPHWQAVRVSRPPVGFLEIHAENFLGDVGWDILTDLRDEYPFSVHAVGLSIASADGIDRTHLDRVATLIRRLEPVLVSDHLCWCSHDGVYFNDLMPFPYTEESLAVVSANIGKIQDCLKRPLLIENISSYVRFVDSQIPEGEFMAALVERSGCGILCDVNNAYVNQINHDVNASAWLKTLPTNAVREIHLAGHCVNHVDDGEIVIDDHGSTVVEPVWQLYAEALGLFPRASTLIEWDTNIPSLDILVTEAQKADNISKRSKDVSHVVAA